MRRTVLALLLASLLAPTAARADAVPALEYAGPTASISRGKPLVFAVRTTVQAGSVTVRVAAVNATGADGLLTGGDGAWLEETATPTADGLQVWSVPASSVLRRRPGHYYWQAYVDGAVQSVGRVQPLDVTLPRADRGAGSLVPRFGRRGRTSFLVSSANLPPKVSTSRLRSVLRSAAARWGLRAGRSTAATAGVQDGLNVAGFTTDLPAGTLGLQTDFVRGGRVIERDLALRTDENWAAGPDFPMLDQIDLESVVLHELGHMAGNKRHQARCSNSPMIDALGAGEWWRGPRDRWFQGCARTLTRAGTLAHRVVRMD